MKAFQLIASIFRLAESNDFRTSQKDACVKSMVKALNRVATQL